mgnify:CR=1 FL=1
MLFVVYLLMGLELLKATLHVRVDTDNIEGIEINLDII